MKDHHARRWSTAGLAGGWGHSWRHGVPGYGKTTSDVQFIAFHPQLGRFVTDNLEIYGEGTMLVYTQPEVAVAGGLAGLGGRYHLWSDCAWTPYVGGVAGLIWTGLDIPELDRAFNFQLAYTNRTLRVPCELHRQSFRHPSANQIPYARGRVESVLDTRLPSTRRTRYSPAQ